MNALPGPVAGGGKSLGGCLVLLPVLFVIFVCVVWIPGRVLGFFGPLESPPGSVTTTQNGTTQNPIDILRMSGGDPNDDLTRSQANRNQADTFKTIEEGYAIQRESEARACDIRNDCNLYWQQSQPKEDSSGLKSLVWALIGVIVGGGLILRILFGAR